MSSTNIRLPQLSLRPLRALAAATTLSLLSVGAFAQQFTFNPSAIGLGSGNNSFSADTLQVLNYATVSFSGTSFEESGFLAVASPWLNGSPSVAPGFNAGYGLFVEYAATGSLVTGAIDSLNYSFYGYNGVGSFTPTTVNTSNPILLGTGSLISGAVGSTIINNKVVQANAVASLTFAADPAASAFFASPDSFYTLAEASFINFGTQITTLYTNNTISGFTLRNGGGSINFVAAPVPEPETYAMLLAGLGLVAGMARWRARRRTA